MSLISPVPQRVMPQLQVLAAFGTTGPLPGAWSDISPYVRSGSIQLSADRLAGPLYDYQAATATLTLKNGDGRFDPDNLNSPYVTTSGLQSVTEILAPGTTAWTAPAALVGTIHVGCWAAGGGSGGGSNYKSGYGGGGGGAGGYSAEPQLAVTAGVTYACAIGAGGSGRGAGVDGNPGGNTTFAGDSLTITAYGGAGGTHGVGGSHQGGGGAGGVISTNSISYAGGTGGNGGGGSGGGGGGSGGPSSAGGNGANGASGSGGAGAAPVTGGGNGGNGGKSGRNGSVPTIAPGGGGGGGGGLAAGADGTDGQIILTYTIAVATSVRTEITPMTPLRVVAAYAINQRVNFETGLDPWLPQGGAGIKQDTSYSLWGSTSLKLTPGGVAYPQIISEDIPLPPGAGTVSMMASLLIPGGWPGGATAAIEFLSASGSFIGILIGNASSIPDGRWVSLAVNGASVPAGTAFLRGRVQIQGNPPASLPAWIDQIVIAPGRTAGAFPLFTGYVQTWQDTGIPSRDPSPGAVPYTGYSEVAVTAQDAFYALSNISLPTLSAAVGAGEDAGARIARILAAVGWPSSMSSLESGSTELQGTTLGDSALDLMQVAADTEGGILFVDGAGAVTFLNRQSLYSDPASSTVQAVFGDRPGNVQPNGPELPYTAITRTVDDTTLFNDIQFTPAGGQNMAEAQDPASEAQYLFPHTYQRTDLLFVTDADALAAAQWVLYIAGTDENRVDQLVVDPMRAPADLYPVVLGLGIPDLIEVFRRPPGMSLPVDRALFVRSLQYTWDFSTPSFEVTFSTQDAGKYASVLRLGDPVYGALDINALGY